jgi:hypothetical protein
MEEALDQKESCEKRRKTMERRNSESESESDFELDYLVFSPKAQHQDRTLLSICWTFLDLHPTRPTLDGGPRV